MDRLTKLIAVGKSAEYALKDDITPTAAIKLLGEYEDTGMTPEEIIAMEEKMAKAIERLYELDAMLSRYHQRNRFLRNKLKKAGL